MRPRATTSLAVAAALAVAVGLPGGAAPARAALDRDPGVLVDAAIDLGPSNQHLVGMGWNLDDAPLAAAVEELRPHTIRTDARLERFADPRAHTDGWASVADDPAMASLVRRTDEIRSIGATPHVILSYLPPWLGGNAYGRDETRVSPDDLDAWQSFVTQVVRVLADHVAATTPDGEPVGHLRFEVWNEPDIPIFFQDWPPGFIDMVLRTHRAVAAVEVELGGSVELEIGGPATFFPDPVYIADYVEAVTREGLPLDFVSWHWYANTPFIGPDGAEDILPPYLLPLYPVAGQRNPVASPLSYEHQVAAVRTVVDAVLAGRPGYDPDLVIDEWNLSAGGFDVRHDTEEGAAFALAALISMERSGLDGADFYRSIGSATPGDWGMTFVHPDTSEIVRKPTWWAFDLWQRTTGTRVADSNQEADELDGFLTRATRNHDASAVHLVVTSFSVSGPEDRVVLVAFDHMACPTPDVDVSGLDGSSAETAALVDPPAGSPPGVSWWSFELPEQSARQVTAACP